MKNRIGREIIVVFLLLLFSGNYWGQVYSITDDLIFGCSGSVMDDGLDAASSSSNLDETSNVCSGTSPIHLDFVQFQLGQGDFLEIYDGPDTSSPLIGSYSGTQLFNQLVSSSAGVSCLTLHFVTNGFSNGDFTAEISCGTLCTDPIPASFAVDTTYGCIPLEVVFTSDYTNFQDVSQMIWHFDDGTQASALGTVRHVFDSDGFFNPWLEVIDRGGCIYSDTLSVPIRVRPLPVSAFSVSPFETTLPSTSFELIPEATGAVLLEWDFDGYGNFFALDDTTFAFPEDKVGTYIISLIAQNEFGCTDTSQRVIEVKDDLDIYLPNAFTPDGDNLNDAWFVQGKGFIFNAFSVEIFDRWGDLVYSSTDPLQAWTGSKLGSEYFVPDGMYFYRVYVQDNENNVNHLYTGHIQILR
jgi:gliding motility-associated-like protein